MFREIMPAFTADVLPDAVLQHYIDMANGVVLEARWHSLWKEGMRLYIAHFATLYLGVPESGASREQIANAGKVQGGITNKSVGSISVGYDNGQDATSDLTGWGAWNLRNAIRHAGPDGWRWHDVCTLRKDDAYGGQHAGFS